MKPMTLAIILGAVFITATLVTAFALTLTTAPGAAGASFVSRLFASALRYGWAAGLAVSAIFFFLRR